MKKGFTLVELLVVIAIISVLVSIGISVYSTAQKSARDSRRKQEISALAKALEASRNFSTALYKYSSDTFNSDFPAVNGQPSDSLYCIWAKKKSDTNPAPRRVPPPAPTNAYTSCTNPDQCSGVDGCTVSNTFLNGITNIDFTNGEIASWTVCANLEVDKPFCRSSMSN